jgi:hypothetical protein
LKPQERTLAASASFYIEESSLNFSVGGNEVGLSGLASSKGLLGMNNDDDARLRLDPRSINDGADTMCDLAEADQFDPRMGH